MSLIRYLAGAELEMALPLPVLAPGQSLNITAATYHEWLQLAFLGLASQVSDVQRLADLTVQALAELSQPESKPVKRRSGAARKIKEATT